MAVRWLGPVSPLTLCQGGWTSWSVLVAQGQQAGQMSLVTMVALVVQLR